MFELKQSSTNVLGCNKIDKNFEYPQFKVEPGLSVDVFTIQRRDFNGSNWVNESADVDMVLSSNLIELFKEPVEKDDEDSTTPHCVGGSNFSDDSSKVQDDEDLMAAQSEVESTCSVDLLPVEQMEVEVKTSVNSSVKVGELTNIDVDESLELAEPGSWRKLAHLSYQWRQDAKIKEEKIYY